MRQQFIFILALAVAATAGAQVGTMEFCAVVGTVTDTHGNPVPGVKVEIRFAEDSGSSQSDEFDRGDDWPDESARNFNRDVAVFGWGTTDEDGKYKITGVQKPGAFMLLIRNQKQYRRVEAPISIDMAVGDEFVADLVLAPAGKEPPQGQSQVLETIAAAQEAERAGDLVGAMAELEKASAMVPSSAIPNFHLARLAFASGDDERALTQAQAASSKDAACADCWVLQARIERDLGHSDEARECAEKALEISPDMPTAHGIMGLLLYEAKEYPEALPSLEAAAAAGDPDPNVHLFLANSYLVLRQGEPAVEAYRDYLELFPDAPNRDQVERMLAQLTGPPQE
jgi:tetratricopeptide (TPR) repeat protein